MKSCYNHLLSSLSNENHTEDPDLYYKPVNKFSLEEAKNKITNVIKEALDGNIISKSEFKEMIPQDKNPSTFYCNFKVHKQTEHNNIPPVRPIISASGSITENISLYVEHHIKETSTKHPSYLQDTPHFLRVIHKVNSGPKLPENAMLVAADVTGAYANIPQDDGSQCLKEVLEEREDKEIPTDFLVKLMDLIQKYNIFEFHQSFVSIFWF